MPKIQTIIQSISKAPGARTEKIEGRKHLIHFIKQKAWLLQAFKEKHQEGPEALKLWFDALPEGYRKIIAIIKRSEELPIKPTLTQKEFKVGRKGFKPKTPQPPQQLPLKNALDQLQNALNNLKNKLAA